MKLKWLSFAIALLFPVEAFGQLDSISIPVYKSGDTSLHYKWQRERIADMKMIDPLASKYMFMMRISCENWSVELSSLNRKFLSGRLYLVTKKVDMSADSDGKILFKAKRISPSDVMAIYRAFERYSIDTIPDQNVIHRWPLVFDGMTYIVEYKTFSTYTFKTYTEPSSSGYYVKEAAVIADFIKEIEARLELGTSYLAFLNKLPPGTYHTGGITTYTNTGKKGKTSR